MRIALLTVLGAMALLTLGCAQHRGGSLIPGGDSVSNGGGLGEKNLYYSYFRLAHDLQSCFTSMTCNVPPEDEAVLRRIYDAIMKGVENTMGLVYVAPSTHPGFFVMNGVHKTARTGTKPGDLIYVNTDHLYVSDRGALRPISVREGTAMLIHELAHHQGIGNSDAEIARLHRLSTAVVNFLTVEAAGGAKSGLARAEVSHAQVLRCELEQGLIDGESVVRIFFERRKDDSRYTAQFGVIPREADRFPIRIKSGPAQMQILPAIGGEPKFDLRIAVRPNLPEEQGNAMHPNEEATRYTAWMSREGRREERWKCVIQPEALRIVDPTWVLFLK